MASSPRFRVLASLFVVAVAACAAPMPSELGEDDITSGSKPKPKKDDDDDDNNDKRRATDDDAVENVPEDRNSDRLDPTPTTTTPARDAGTSTDVPPGGNGQPTCTRDADCSLSFICQRSVCVSGCRNNDDCPLNEHCDLGRGECAAGAATTTTTTTQCTIDENCPLGRICQGGACVLGCRSTFDCPLNQSCILGFCF